LENKWRLFLNALTAVSVVTIVVEYPNANLTTLQQNGIYIFDFFVVSLLAIDFCKELKKSKLPLSKYLAGHWYEIPSMMPLVLFSTLEHEFLIGSIVRSVRLIGIFRIIHLFSKTITIFEGNRLMYIMAFAMTSVFLGAFAEYIVESSIEGTKINTFGDALWWSIVTVTTVGYGDIYPITTAGRFIASILMVIGIMILGMFVSTLGNALIESRLSKLKNPGDLKTKGDNVTEKNIYFTNFNDSNKAIKEETKLLIKNKIDYLDSLGDDELDLLINLIKTIHRCGKS
jgi:voltage-gated potassium channel